MILPMASTTTIHGTLRDLLGFINIRGFTYSKKKPEI
jgi:hypothetical protein